MSTTRRAPALTLALASLAVFLAACASSRPPPGADEPPPRWGDRYWGESDRVPSPRPLPMPSPETAVRTNGHATAILTREAAWIRDREWTGESPRRTEVFLVASRWRLLWRSVEGNPDAPLVIEAYRAEGDELIARVSQDGPAETSSLQLPEPGTYYLEIRGGGAWYVAIEVPAP